MDENAVIDSVCARLQALDCEVTQRLRPTQQGIDIIAHNPKSGEQFFIEAKGGTSSRQSSPRFGQPYTPSVVFNRVAKGVFTCIEHRAKYPEREKVHVILAVPDTEWFRSYLTPVLQNLHDAGVEVWFESHP